MLFAENFLNQACSIVLFSRNWLKVLGPLVDLHLVGQNLGLEKERKKERKEAIENDFPFFPLF